MSSCEISPILTPPEMRKEPRMPFYADPNLRQIVQTPIVSKQTRQDG